MLTKSGLKLPFRHSSGQSAKKQQPREEGGWALLSLILALTILSIVLTSQVQPNYQLSVQREKEAELFYRGQQMAEGIARWYNNGELRPETRINLAFPPVYGYLKELKKLKEGITINLREKKLVRPSAMIDPFDGEEWEPVYARDPRIMPFLQAWAAETGGIIPQELMLLAGPPTKLQRVNPNDPNRPNSTSGTSGQSGTTGTAGGSTAGGGSGLATPPPGSTTGQQRPNQPNKNDDDDDDDDDDDVNDPLAHLFGGFSGSSNKSNLPIVGVAPRRKGPSIRAFYGLQNYEEWVFIYIPTSPRVNLPNQTGQPGQQPGGQPPLRVNQ